MKKLLIVSAALAASFVVSPLSAEAKCYGSYFTGHGNAKTSKTGLANAREDWSNKVDAALPWPYATWAKGYDKSWGCEWAKKYKKIGKRNYCYARAKPCK
jgi:hypothetical protein